MMLGAATVAAERSVPTRRIAVRHVAVLSKESEPAITTPGYEPGSITGLAKKPGFIEPNRQYASNQGHQTRS
jgi:hypothetical protein